MIFLDRDGTLNPDPGYIARLEDYHFYDFTMEALKLLAEKGQRFCLITNQSGIARGIIKQADLDAIHAYIRKAFAEYGIPLYNIYFCTDHPDRATEFRKPGKGMFLKAARDFNLRLKDCLMIGDSRNDIEAGFNLGLDTMLVLTGAGLKTEAALPEQIIPTFTAQNLLQGARHLVEIIE